MTEQCQLGAGAWVLWACRAASRAWLHGVQAYRTWLETEHEWLFYVNNDVLVPDGAIDAMAQAMTAAGAGRCSPLGLDHFLSRVIMAASVAGAVKCALASMTP